MIIMRATTLWLSFNMELEKTLFNDPKDEYKDFPRKKEKTSKKYHLKDFQHKKERTSKKYHLNYHTFAISSKGDYSKGVY